MYGLDVNFLNDRPEYRPEPTERRRAGSGGAPESRQALFIGLIAGLALVGLSTGAWLFLQQQNGQLREDQAQLEAQLGQLKTEQAKLKQVADQTSQIKDETTALAGVFGSIKPWSAIFNEIVGRAPSKVRIVSMRDIPQTETSQLPLGLKPSPSPSASGAASGAATAQTQSGLIEIIGTALSINDVNDFLLNLQQSKFFNPETTNIAAINQGKPIPVIAPGESQSNAQQATLPAQVEFKIVAALTSQSSADLLPELERNRATGLVTRIETLRQKGGSKP